MKKVKLPSKKQIDRVEKDSKELFEKMRNPSWMPNEKSSHGEWLEFRAITMPFKWQQMIDIYEKMVSDNAFIAKVSKGPAERKEWLKKVDACRKTLEQMRQQWPMIRLNAEMAQQELDELL